MKNGETWSDTVLNHAQVPPHFDRRVFQIGAGLQQAPGLAAIVRLSLVESPSATGQVVVLIKGHVVVSGNDHFHLRLTKARCRGRAGGNEKEYETGCGGGCCCCYKPIVFIYKWVILSGRLAFSCHSHLCGISFQPLVEGLHLLQFTGVCEVSRVQQHITRWHVLLGNPQRGRRPGAPVQADVWARRRLTVPRLGRDHVDRSKALYIALW